MQKRLPLAASWLKTVIEIAIRSVGPKQVMTTVKNTLVQAELSLEPRSYYLIGIGKAADAQVKIWLDDGPEPLDYRVFGVHGYGSAQIIKRFGGNHPVPGPESFRAGLALTNWIRTFDPYLPVLVLMSGGGSAAIEHPAPGFKPAEISEATELLLSRHIDIETINAIRSQWSALKAGGGLHLLGKRQVILSVHSDVPPGIETLVSSGPFDPGPFKTAAEAASIFAELFPKQTWQDLDSEETLDNWHGLRILSGNNVAAMEAIRHAGTRDQFDVALFPEGLSGDVESVGQNIARKTRQSQADVLVFGGEPTVDLPDHPGKGGRMGRLALAYGMADWDGPPCPMLAAASDGVDGSSAGAGAYWLPGPYNRTAAERAFDQFDSDTFFNKMGWLLKLPPTNVNVRDLVVVLKNTDKLNT